MAGTFKSNLVVYTARTDNRDALIDPEVITDGVRYVCMSDEPSGSAVWEHVPIDFWDDDPVRRARWCKVVAYSRFDAPYSVWMDATYTPRRDPFDLVYRHLVGYDVAAYPHFERNCIYAEADVVLAGRVDDPRAVASQVEWLQGQGYPKRNGLFDTSILVRRHSPAVAEACSLWWDVISNGSRRDQLSFNYVLWKCGLPCNRLAPGTTRRANCLSETFQPYFTARFHRAKQWRG